MAPPVLLTMARKWISSREKTSYAWFFDRMLPGDDNGAWHSSDLWYWFGTLENCWRPMEKKDFELSDQMTDYLTDFCKSGDPNGEGRAVWHPAAKVRKEVMRFGEGQTRMGTVSMLKLIKTMLTNKAVGE